MSEKKIYEQIQEIRVEIGKIWEEITNINNKFTRLWWETQAANTVDSMVPDLGPGTAAIEMVAEPFVAEIGGVYYDYILKDKNPTVYLPTSPIIGIPFGESTYNRKPPDWETGLPPEWELEMKIAEMVTTAIGQLPSDYDLTEEEVYQQLSLQDSFATLPFEADMANVGREILEELISSIITQKIEEVSSAGSLINKDELSEVDYRLYDVETSWNAFKENFPVILGNIWVELNSLGNRLTPVETSWNAFRHHIPSLMQRILVLETRTLPQRQLPTQEEQPDDKQKGYSTEEEPKG